MQRFNEGMHWEVQAIAERSERLSYGEKQEKGDNSLVERSGHSASSKALEGILINVGRIFPRFKVTG